MNCHYHKKKKLTTKISDEKSEMALNNFVLAKFCEKIKRNFMSALSKFHYYFLIFKLCVTELTCKNKNCNTIEPIKSSPNSTTLNGYISS